MDVVFWTVLIWALGVALSLAGAYVESRRTKREEDADVRITALWTKIGTIDRALGVVTRVS